MCRYPLITLSTRAQVEKKKANTGTFAAAKRIVDREGIQGLYAGMESALFGITVTNFVYYYCMTTDVMIHGWLNADSSRVRVQPSLLPKDDQEIATQHRRVDGGRCTSWFSNCLPHESNLGC